MANDKALVDPALVQARSAELMARDRWPRQRLLELQRLRLDELLRHAASASPYYRETMGPAIEKGSPLEELPILPKRTLMAEWDRIVTDRRVRLAEVEAHLAGVS